MPREIPNLLFELHQNQSAEFQAYDQLQIVSTFGQPETEYAAIRKAAGLMDQPQRGFLEVRGADRLAFLNNLLTNQTWDKATRSGLRAGQGVYAFFLARSGRIISDMNVLERGDFALLEMDARRVEPVRESFQKYIFTERVELTDRTESLHQVALHGPKALEVLRQATGAELPELSELGSTSAKMFDVDVTIWRDDPAAVPGYHLVFDRAAAKRVWTELISRFAQAQEPGRRLLRPIGWVAFNAARIEGGRPIFGIDFDESVLPHETGQLSRAVSFTKGCYLGQEIVARMQARGQFARQLVGIKMSDDALPIAGAAIYDDANNQIGGITSSTVSPILSNAAICVGYVKRAFTPADSIVRIPAEGQIREGKVVELPFLR